MARQFPVRTALFNVGLPVIAALQVANALVNDAPLLPIAAFAAVLVAFAVQLTRYQLATYRRERLDGSLAER